MFFLRPCNRALLHLRLALPRQGFQVSGVKQKRLAIKADRFACQSRKPRNLSQRIKRTAITRINAKRSFERIIGPRQIAHFLGCHALGKPSEGQRVYLRIRLLPVASARYCRKRQRQSSGSRGTPHNFLQQRFRLLRRTRIIFFYHESFNRAKKKPSVPSWAGVINTPSP